MVLRRAHICTPKGAYAARCVGAICIGLAVLGVIAAAFLFIVTGPSGKVAHFSCSSDLALGPVSKPASKGLCVDDTTFSVCPSMIPSFWPNTNEPISSLRLFAAWKEQWPEFMRERAWDELKYHVEANDVKVLLGTEITCNETADAIGWEWTKQLLKKLGPDRLIGLAIGNEMDLLFTKAPIFHPPGCLSRLWTQNGFVNTFLSRVQELDEAVPGFKEVPVMSVWSTYCFAGEPFVDSDNAKCLTLFREATARYAKRFVFAFNIYPYFDVGNHLDAGTTDKCTESLKKDVCFDNNCFTNNAGAEARRRMRELTGTDDYQLWIGESGWSTPVSSTTQPQMKACLEWSSPAVFQQNYDGWLQWDLGVKDSEKPADHAFYFTMRDAANFGEEEHFGLIEHCGSQRCKLDKSGNASIVHDSVISV